MEKYFQVEYALALAIINNFVRYFFFAGILYLIFYVWRKENFAGLKIQKKSKTIVSAEIYYSMLTLLIQGLTAYAIHLCANAGWTTFYLRISDHGLPYFIITIVLMILIHDAYFYWTHRMMHSPALFKYFHLVHHRSTSPTPWAAFSFHPLEAIVSVLIMPFFIFIFPVHPLAIIIFLLWMTIINVMGHLGYETFSEKLRATWFGKWHNNATNHDLHHLDSKHNFGLYFTFWDRIMGTYKEDKKIT